MTNPQSAIRNPQSRAGFTLVELIVALALTVLISGATVGVLRSATAARERLDRRMELQAQARAAIETIVAALRNSCRFADGNEPALEGLDDWQGGLPSDRIRFRAVGLAPIRPGKPESDVRQCELALAQSGPDGLSNLVMRLDPTRNPEPDGGGVLQPVARNIVALDFAYHDGSEWVPRWERDRKDRPVAIRVDVVAMAPKPPVETVSLRRIVNFPYWPTTDQPGGPTPPGAGSTPPAGAPGPGAPGPGR